MITSDEKKTIQEIASIAYSISCISTSLKDNQTEQTALTQSLNKYKNNYTYTRSNIPFNKSPSVRSESSQTNNRLIDEITKELKNNEALKRQLDAKKTLENDKFFVLCDALELPEKNVKEIYTYTKKTLISNASIKELAFSGRTQTLEQQFIKIFKNGCENLLRQLRMPEDNALTLDDKNFPPLSASLSLK